MQAINTISDAVLADGGTWEEAEHINDKLCDVIDETDHDKCLVWNERKLSIEQWSMDDKAELDNQIKQVLKQIGEDSDNG